MNAVMNKIQRHCKITVTLYGMLVLASACGDSSTTHAPSSPDNAVAVPSVQTEIENKTPQWPYLTDDPVALAANPLQKNFYVVFDGSGSMQASGCAGGNSKAVAAKKALENFAAAVPASANMGMLAFDNSGVGERVPLGTNNRKQFIAALKAVIPAGNTPLQTSIKQAFDKLTLQGKSQLGYGEYHLVVVTDGEASADEDPSDVVSEILDHSPVIIHTIGFCIGNRHSLNQKGRILYKSANDPASLQQGLEGVLAEAPAFSVGDFN